MYSISGMRLNFVVYSVLSLLEIFVNVIFICGIIREGECKNYGRSLARFSK